MPEESRLSEINLAKLVAAGDENAFNSLYADQKDRVYSMCLKFFAHLEDAEDMTQDVFIQISKKIHLYRGDAKLSTWIYAIALNQCRMKLRAQKNKIALESFTEDEAEFERLTQKHSTVPRYDTTMLIKSAIAELPKGYKRAFVLHAVEGFEHAEIAEITGQSEGTSKSQFHKARIKMRDIIKRKANPKLHQPPVFFDSLPPAIVRIPREGQQLRMRARKPQSDCHLCAIARKFGKVVSCGCMFE